ncbi:MAG: two-component system, chemotaxis family, protein-glutamate methylesterase/glutaminase [Thermosediminibacterales bacterium]|nr:two-component system, chemotaxis family, protein-glutamate methylesterase/glutaminase [Thermosediminibacterales bacterium]
MLKNIVIIGASTGGPSALKEVLKAIPRNVPASFLIVQHMPQGFTRSLAERLNMISELRVKEAEDGDIIRPGTAFVAPGNFHMTINQINSKYYISLNQKKEVSGHRPSVNVLIESTENITGLNLIFVILTGMGSDGASAIKKIKKKRQITVITQDENTSVVYGMPKAVNDMGIADMVLPLPKIGYKIVEIINRR